MVSLYHDIILDLTINLEKLDIKKIYLQNKHKLIIVVYQIVFKHDVCLIYHT